MSDVGGGLIGGSARIRTATIPAPPHFRPDYAQRLRLVDVLLAQVTDANVLASLVRAREQLAAVVAAAGSPAQ